MTGIESYVTIRVLFFAVAREFTKEKEACIRVPIKIQGKELLNLITKKFHLDALKCNVILALNETWIDLNSELNLNNNDEVAVIPPLSGEKGKIMNWVKLTNEKLSVESIFKMVCSPEFGAVSVFVGTTRNNFQGKTVAKLEYEAYEGMAVKSLENICGNIRQKYDVGNIAIYHRLGDVPIEEASVVIAISSAHRKPALEAVPYAIDALKANVPIWKKEVYEEGNGAEWKENSESLEVVPSGNNNVVDLYEEIVEADTGNDVPSNLIQINANLQEINRRISSFINRKRQHINLSNIQDFCVERSENADDGSCARVSAVLVRRKDSKSHLKVHRVENTVGPQTHESGLPFHENPSKLPCPPGAEERIANAERYLNMNPTATKDVFSRLKAIEDKILYLESISPEYFDFDREDRQKRKANKRTYSSSELDLKMQLLEAKLQKKTVRTSVLSASKREGRKNERPPSS